MPDSVMVTSTSRNGRVSDPCSAVNLIFLCCLFSKSRNLSKDVFSVKYTKICRQHILNIALDENQHCFVVFCFPCSICSTTALFQKEVTELRSMFQENGYPKSYFDKIFKRFLTEQDAKEKTIPDTSEKENYYITIPYLENESRRFINKLAKIIKNKINVNVVPVYKSFKIGRYFQLKSDTPLALCSNVVYQIYMFM